MNKGIGVFAGLTALFAMGSAGAVCPGPEDMVFTDINDATGHHFEVYKADGITWDEAAACAEQPLGDAPGAVVGHLATITSSSENQWVIDELLTVALGADPALEQSQVWVGGYQEPGSGEPGDGWRWVNGEGPFPGSNGNLDYANWAATEPNDNGGSEDHLTVGRYPDNLYGWNDEGSAPSSIGGFIVEYDTPRTSSDCVGTTTEACTTVEGQTLTFPAGSFDQTDGNIEFTAYEFNDPRVDAFGKCTINPGPLTLFTDPAFGGNVELRIPEYLCGSPKFVVVKVDSEDLTILKGAVLVENEPETVLPDNLYKCWDPILGNLGPDFDKYFADPQYQDVVVWQSTDPTKMLENQFGTGIYVGAATEATNGCGSTRAKVRGASYFVVGMHIDFGGGFDYADNALGNYQQFVALSRYKLTLLRKSIAAARSSGSLKPVVSTAMDALIALAIYRLDHGNPAGALIQVKQFLWLVNAAAYKPITGANYNGDHLMRGENIAFMLRVKVIPYKPVP